MSDVPERSPASRGVTESDDVREILEDFLRAFGIKDPAAYLRSPRDVQEIADLERHWALPAHTDD